jgi:hypothetical protein
MKTILTLAVLLAAATPALAEDTAPAQPASRPAQTSVCLRHHDVDGWGARDKHSMVVNDRFGRKYLVSLNGLCDDLNFAFGAGFRPLGGGPNFGSCVDRGDRVVMGGGGASHMSSQTCWVGKVQLYTKDMEAADKLARANKQPLAAY